MKEGCVCLNCGEISFPVSEYWYPFVRKLQETGGVVYKEIACTYKDNFDNREWNPKRKDDRNLSLVSKLHFVKDYSLNVSGVQHHEVSLKDDDYFQKKYKDLEYVARGLSFYYSNNETPILHIVYNTNTIATGHIDVVNAVDSDISNGILFELSIEISVEKENEKRITNEYVCPFCKSPLDDECRGEKSLLIYDMGQCRTDTESYLKEIEGSLTSSISVSNNDISVEGYIKNLRKIESGITFYTKVLIKLYRESYSHIRKYNRYLSELKRRLQEEAEEKRKNIEKEIAPDNIEIASILKTEHGLTRPNHPIAPMHPEAFDLTRPIEPVLEKPGLFNRKKVEASNKAIIEQYEKELATYESKEEIYNSSLKEYEHEKLIYNEKVKEYEEELAIYERSFDKVRDEIIANKRDDYRSEWEEIKCIEDAADGNNQEYLHKRLEHSPEYQIYQFYISGIEEVKDILRNLLQCKCDYHSLNVIYPKYLDIVALTTILEYYETGRVSELKGPDGAYNLYESELRQNIIITKLDTIINQLEQIKSNQYMLYNELQKIEIGVESMSNKLDDIGKSISDMEKNVTNKLEDISKNTAVTAYFAEKTAQYTKRQNELTDALGFLVALK